METNNNDYGSGSTEEDWKIFDILCSGVLDVTCRNTLPSDHLNHSLDLVTSLRSELAACTYKRDRLIAELTETKSALCAKENENESLKAQAARQSSLISSLQSRLQAIETRERNIQSRCDASIETLKREKRSTDEKNKELLAKIRCLEVELSNQESHKEQARTQLHELIRKLCVCLGIDVCDVSHLTPDCVVSKAGEVVSELQRLRTKVASTCDALATCENELLTLKSVLNVEKQRMCTQIETLESHNQDLETRYRQTEKELQMMKDKCTEYEICNEKLRDELRGFESRCHRLQNNIDRSQNDRLQFLRTLATIVDASEACETLIKDKVREVINENQIIQTQLQTLREQLSAEMSHYKESLETTNCRLKNEEAQRCDLEERMEKINAELQDLRSEHMSLAEFLVRLAKSLSWSECTSPPAPGPDTTILAESLLDRAERLASHHQLHSRSCDKNCWEHNHHHHPHHHHHNAGTKLRRERSCHDLPLKDCSSILNLQKRIRVLREQISRRDLHLELLRRKVSLLEESAKTKSALQSERDDALNRMKRFVKQTDKLSAQLVEAKKQISELKSQLAEAAEHKISSLEKARKIDELTGRLCDIESEKNHLQGQISTLKERIRSMTESSQERRCRDETLINSLRDDVSRLKTQLSDANHRLSHLQTFRTSVARTLHLRDIPETDILHRLQHLCNSYQEFPLRTKLYESISSSIGGDHLCTTHHDDTVVPLHSSRHNHHQHHHHHYRPLSSGSPHSHHHHHHHSSRNYDTNSGNNDNNRNSHTNHHNATEHRISSGNSGSVAFNNRNISSATLPRRLETNSRNSGNYDDHHFDEDFDFNKKLKEF